MSNSVLLRIPVGADGLLLDDQDAWMVGPTDKDGVGISGIHNLSTSVHYPGCVWLSLQLANTIVLLDAATMATRKVIICPSLLTRADGTAAKIGGPCAAARARTFSSRPGRTSSHRPQTCVSGRGSRV